MKKGSRILLSVVLVLGLLLILASSAVLYLGLTDSGTRWALARIKSSVNAVPGSTLDWRAAEGTLLSGLEVRDLRYATTVEAGPIAVTIPYLSFSWQPLGLLKYAVVIDPLQIDGLQYEADGVAQEEPPMTADTFRAMLFDLPVSVELQNVSVRNFSFRRNESNFVIDSLSGSAALDGDALQLANLEVGLQASALSGSLTLDESLAAEGNIMWQTRFSERDYSGELNIAGDLQRLQLDHALLQPLQINSSGVVIPGFLAGPALGLDLRHTFATLDMAAFGQEGIVLQQGDIVTAGSPAALAIRGVLQGQIRDFELLTLNLDVGYQPETLTFNSVDLNSTQLAMNASGAFQMSPRALQVDWTLDRLDPGGALPNMRLADVNGMGSVTMSGEPGSEQISLALTGIQGSLNELPLAIAGMATVMDTQLSALDLQVNSGANVFSIDGSAVGELALEWQLQAPQLQQLWRGLDGQLAGQGSITGMITTPAISGRLDGSRIRLAQGDRAILVQSVQLEASASAEDNDITLDIGPVSMQGGPEPAAVQTILEQASIMLGGTPAQHSLSAHVALADADVSFDINGGLEAGNWQGQLQTSDISGSYGNWQQEDRIAMSYVNSALSVEQGCWNYGLIRLCLQADKPAASGLNAELELRNIPLAWLDFEPSATTLALTPVPLALQELQDANGLTLPPGLRAEGDVDVQVAVVNFANSTWDSLDVAVVPENVVLQIDFAANTADATAPAEVERFGFTADTIHATSVAGAWAAELQLRVVRQTISGDVFQGNLSAQLAMAANEELDGELRFNFDQLGWIETLAPAFSEPYGSFNGNIAISGNKSAPALNGQVQLANAGFAIPDYGLAVTDIALTLRNLGNSEFLLEGSANSGEGALALRTTMTNLPSPDRAIKAEITGTDFSVINTDYARANLSPQLQLAFVNRELTVTGGIILPLLDLDLEEMFATASPGGVDVSRDVVVINATPDAAVAADPQSVPIPLNADVSLLLGEDVRLRGYGLDTRLSGELSLEQAPNRPMLVYGELGIPEGSFEMYNQMLMVEDGRLMFFGNPANPVVDIRAFRETNDAEVGILLSGNIKDMQGDLYSSPDLPEDEILALLVTGKSFNNVGGQDSNALLGAIANFGLGRSEGLTNRVSSKLGFDSLTVEGGSTLEDSALGLGKYITPDLLLRYKVGLFDRQSALSIDYNLTERIKLEVQTGISQSVDISYTIETD